MDEDLLDTSVLVVDDSSLNIRVISNIITPLGFKVYTAKSGKKALQFLNKFIPSLIIMDLKMPEMDGFECCQHIKKMSGCSNIPIIIVTGSHDMQDITTAELLGACSYITKPVVADVLIEQLKTFSPFEGLADEVRV